MQLGRVEAAAAARVSPSSLQPPSVTSVPPRRDYFLVSGPEDILQRMARNQSVCADLLVQWQSGVDVAKMEAGVRNVCSVRVSTETDTL